MREWIGADEEKVLFRLTMLPYEIDAACEETGLPAAAFTGVWDAWYFDPPGSWVLCTHRPSREPAALAWVQAYISTGDRR